MPFLKKNYLFLIIALAILFIYWSLPQTFFQQDEWLAFGGFLNSQGNGGFLKFLNNTIANSGSVHIIPLGVLRSYLQIKMFHLNFVPYAILSILNHVINAFLVVYLAKIIFKKKLPAFIVGIIFGASSTASQAVIWIGASINTQNSTTFLLLSIIFFLKFIDNTNIKKYLIGTLFMILIGLLFKESVFFLFLFFPILMFFSFKEKKKILKTPILFILFGLIYSLSRIPSFIGSLSHAYGNALSVGMQTEPMSYLLRLLILPFRIIPQTIIPQDIIMWLSENATRYLYPHLFVAEDGFVDGVVRESIAYDFLSFILCLVIIAISIFVYKIYASKKDLNSIKALIFSSLLIITSGLPLILISDRPGFNSIFEPRHLYIATIGSSIFITVFLMGLLEGRKKSLFFYAFIVLILFWNIKSIKSDLSYQEQNGKIRQAVLSTIQEKYPQLPGKVIFYVESDTTYYGLPESEKILPFQSGLGQTLLVWYSVHNNQFPSCFFNDTFLYQIDEEGYRFCQQRGFGYFRKMENLKKAISENKFNLDNLIAFKWNGLEEKIIDITEETKKMLKNKRS